MLRWCFSYIGERGERQSPSAAKAISVAFLAIQFAGCASSGSAVGDKAGADDRIATGSIEKTDNKGRNPVAQSDWEIVRQGIARATYDTSFDGVLAWTNPDTGSSGTLKVFDTAAATKKPDCRDFQTTVNDVRGVRHYRGEACRSPNDRWELFGVLADDSELL